MVAVHGRATARRQQNRLGLHIAEAACADVDHQHTSNGCAILGRDQCHGPMLFQPINGPRPNLLHHTVDDFDAG